MARVLEVQLDLNRVPVAWEEMSRPRAPGLHVSQIIRDIDNRLIAQGQRPLDGEMSADELRRAGYFWEAGFCWEDLFEEIWGRRMRRRLSIIDQPALEEDGITGTLDGLMYAHNLNAVVQDLPGWGFEALTLEHFPRVQEFKWTTKSSNRVQYLQEDFRTWFMQMKAYCYLAKTFYADLYPFFAAGNYGSERPHARHFQITFSPQELRQNWDMLVREGRKLV